MKPLVSIIIPTYNTRHWLGEAVNSALTQTYPNCEVLVVDDGSTDGTGRWLAEKYGRKIRYLYKENGGLSSARNFGLHRARGKYIQFLDADDLLLPEKVATHVAYMEIHPEVDVVYSHCLWFYDGRPKELYDWPNRPSYRSGRIFASMIDGGFLLPHVPLSRRTQLDAVGGFDESLTSCIDWDYWLRVAWSGATFFYLEGPAMALYRVRSGSMSSDHVNHGRNALRVLSKIATYVRDPEEQKRLGLHRAQGRWRFAYGKALFEAGQRREGLLQMVRGVLTDTRGIDWKLSYMALALFTGQKNAADIQERLKDIKDYMTSWRIAAIGSRR